MYIYTMIIWYRTSTVVRYVRNVKYDHIACYRIICGAGTI